MRRDANPVGAGFVFADGKREVLVEFFVQLVSRVIAFGAEGNDAGFEFAVRRPEYFKTAFLKFLRCEIAESCDAVFDQFRIVGLEYSQRSVQRDEAKIIARARLEAFGAGNWRGVVVIPVV